MTKKNASTPSPRNSRQIPTALDVFSGCGGLTNGLIEAGFEVLAGVEIKKEACIAYRENYPETRLFEQDIKTLSVNKILTTLSIRRGHLTLLAGCPPCQGFSRMRTKNSAQPAQDERNDLIFEFIRLVEGLLPQLVMLENVPGLKDDWRFRKAVRRLETIGYSCASDVVDAADYGVPQRRKRLILMASRLGSITIPKGNSKRKTVRTAIGDLPAPEKSRKALHKLLAHRSAEVTARIRLIPKNGGSRSALGEENQLACHMNPDVGFSDVYGRMSWDDVAPTITRACTNPSKGRFLHPSQNREISLFEAALLQSFPRSYKFPVSVGREELASMIGEALPPLLARQQAKHLLKHFRSLT